MTHRIHRIAATAAGCSISGWASAQTAAGSGNSAVATSLATLAASTAAVVAIILAAAWLLKRLAPRHHFGRNTLRIIAGTAVGSRERVVVVEIGATWLVLGVAPGQVNLLHQLPQDTSATVTDAVPAAATAGSRNFAQWLSPLLKKYQ
jgi:flagellar protein FliO/FliZ